jgi:hypothetical protein
MIILTFLEIKTMSLGKHTNCDLSAGLAELDLPMLTKQMEIHFYKQMEEVRKMTEIIHNFSTPADKKERLLGMISHGSQSLLSAAQNIAETSELLYTLYDTDNREVEIIREQ